MASMSFSIKVKKMEKKRDIECDKIQIFELVLRGGEDMNDFYFMQVICCVILLILAFIPAKIAKNKGYSFAFYYIFSIFFFPVALITSLMKKNRNTKHTSGDFKTLENYEQMLERGEISYKEFTAKKKELEK